jgi:hypothetical protein
MSQQKQTVVSFRVDRHLAEILDRLPDKSTFIREAILRRFHVACPFCGGRGVLPKALADWLRARTPKFEAIECTCCRYAYPAELVGENAGTDGRDGFVCAHCQMQDHAH